MGGQTYLVDNYPKLTVDIIHFMRAEGMQSNSWVVFNLFNTQETN